MKVLVQWTTAQLSDWEEIDSSSWADTPFRPDPSGAPASAGVNNGKGWVHYLAVQGIKFTADHYHVSDLPLQSGVAVTTWTDPGSHGGAHATRWVILPLSADAAFGGAINTNQTRTMWLDSNYDHELWAACEPLPYDQFVIPRGRGVRHGKNLSKAHHDALYQNQTKTPWTAWATSGQNPFNQRARGHWSPTSHTITYFYSTGANLVSAPVSGLVSGDFGTEDFAVTLTATGTSATEDGLPIDNAENGIYITFTTEANQPNTTTWPTGDYRVNFNVTEIGDDITFGLITIGTHSGRVGMYSVGLSGQTDSISSTSTANNGTGLHVMTAASAWVATPLATDRCTWMIAAGRPADHGNQDIDFHGGDSDAFVDGAWTAPVAVVAHISSLSGVSPGPTLEMAYGGPYFHSAKLYAFAVDKDNVSEANVIICSDAPLTTRDSWSAHGLDGIDMGAQIATYDTLQETSILHIVTQACNADVHYHQWHMSDHSYHISNQVVVGVASFAGGAAGERQGVAITQRGDRDLIIAAIGSGASSLDKAWFYVASGDMTAPVFTSDGLVFPRGTVEDQVITLTPPRSDNDSVLAIFTNATISPDTFGVEIDNLCAVASHVILFANGQQDGQHHGYHKGTLTDANETVLLHQTDTPELQLGLFEVSDVPSATHFSSLKFTGEETRWGGAVTLSNHTGILYIGGNGELSAYVIAGTRGIEWTVSNKGWISVFTGAAGTNLPFAHHNMIDFSSDVGNNSMGSWVEMVVMFNDNDSSVDMVAHATWNLASELSASPAPAIWLIPSSVTFDFGGITVPLDGTQAIAEAQWLIPATVTIDAPLAHLESLSAYKIVSDFVSGNGDWQTRSPYGGPYYYSNQLYALGLQKSRDNILQMIRAVSAPITTRDNWSANWDGILLSDDLETFDSVQFESTIRVGVLTSNKDATYHEFHLSNNTWGISNQPVVTAGAGDQDAGNLGNIGIANRPNGDKLFTGIWSGSVSSVDRTWIFVQSATTAWTDQGLVAPDHFGAPRLVNQVGWVGPDNDNRMFVLEATGQLDTILIPFEADSTVLSHHIVAGMVHDSPGAGAGYVKGTPISASVTIGYQDAIGNEAEVGFVQLSDIPNEYDSVMRIVDLDWFNNNSGTQGGTVHFSEFTVIMGPMVQTGVTGMVFWATGQHSGMSYAEFFPDHFASFNDGPGGGLTDTPFHNVLSFTSDVGNHSFGSGIEAVVLFMDTNSSTDVFAVQIDLPIEVTITSPVETQWLIPTAGPHDIGAVTAGLGAITPAIEARWLVVAPDIDYDQIVTPAPVEARWLIPAANTIFTVNTTPAEAQWLVVAPTIDLAPQALDQAQLPIANYDIGPYRVSNDRYVFMINNDDTHQWLAAMKVSAAGIETNTNWRTIASTFKQAASITSMWWHQDSATTTINGGVALASGSYKHYQFETSNDTWLISGASLADFDTPGVVSVAEYPIITMITQSTITTGTRAIMACVGVESGGDRQARMYANSAGLWFEVFNHPFGSGATNSIMSMKFVPHATDLAGGVQMFANTEGGGIQNQRWLSNFVHGGAGGIDNDVDDSYAVGNADVNWYHNAEFSVIMSDRPGVRMVRVWNAGGGNFFNNDIGPIPGGTFLGQSVSSFNSGPTGANINVIHQPTGDQHMVTIIPTSGGQLVHRFNEYVNSVVSSEWSAMKDTSTHDMLILGSNFSYVGLAGKINGDEATSGSYLEVLFTQFGSGVSFVRMNVGRQVVTPAPIEAQWLVPTAGPHDIGAVATATQPVEARWLIPAANTIFTVNPVQAVEARWLIPDTITTSLGVAPGAVGLFESLSNMEIAASAASMLHFYGGPYYYSAQVYMLGMGKNSNDVMNFVRTNSAPVTVRDNWSATWGGVEMVDDIRAYDSILFNDSIVGVVVQVSQSDVTYHEFHLSNNTWNISNQPVASGGVGGITSAAVLGAVITMRGTDKVIAAMFTHTTSTLNQQMAYVQSADTAWTSQGPINPLQNAGQDAMGVAVAGAAADGDLLFYLNDDAEDVELVHMDGSTSAFGSNFLHDGAAAGSVKSFGYMKGLNANDETHLVYHGGSPTPRHNSFDISTAPTRLGSTTIVVGIGGADAASGYFGGTVILSETMVHIFTFAASNITAMYTNYHVDTSAGLFSHLDTGIPATGDVKGAFHNLLDFASDVGNASYGSGIEALIFFNDNHSSLDVVNVGTEVAQTVTPFAIPAAQWLIPAANTIFTVNTSPAEAQWLTIAPTIDLGGVATATQPVEAQWLVVAPTIDLAPQALAQAQLPLANYDVGPFLASNDRYTFLINNDDTHQWLAVMKSSAAGTETDTNWRTVASTFKQAASITSMWWHKDSATTTIQGGIALASGSYKHFEFETSNDAWLASGALIADEGDTDFISVAEYPIVTMHMQSNDAAGTRSILAVIGVESGGDRQGRVWGNSAGTWELVGAIGPSIANISVMGMVFMPHQRNAVGNAVVFYNQEGGGNQNQVITSNLIIGIPGGIDGNVDDGFAIGGMDIDTSSLEIHHVYHDQIGGNGVVRAWFPLTGGINFDNDIALGTKALGEDISTFNSGPTFQTAIKVHPPTGDLHLVTVIPQSGGQLIHRHNKFTGEVSGGWSGQFDASTHDMLVAGSDASYVGMSIHVNGDEDTSGFKLEVLFTQFGLGVSYVQLTLQTAVTVNPAPVEARWLTIAPTIDLGGVATATQPVEARWLVVAPDIDYDQIVTPTPAEARWLVPAANTIVTVTPTPAEARWLTIAPTIDLGGVSTSTQPVEARWLVPAANTIVTVTPTPAESQWLTIAPTIDLGVVATATQPVEARWLVPAANIIFTVNPGQPVEARWLIPVPTVENRLTQTVDPAPVEARWLTIAPTIDLGGVATATQPVEARWLVVAPDIDYDQIATPAPVEARWLVPAANTIFTVNTSPAEARWLTIAPTIDLGGVSTSTQPVEARWLVPAANAIFTVNTSPAEARWLTIAPTIDLGAIEATVAVPAEARWLVVAPDIDFDIILTPNPAEARWLVNTPTVEGGTFAKEVSPAPIEARWLVNAVTVDFNTVVNPQPVEARWLVIAPTTLNQKIIQLTPFVLSVPTSSTFAEMGVPSAHEIAISAVNATFELTLSLKGL